MRYIPATSPPPSRPTDLNGAKAPSGFDRLLLIRDSSAVSVTTASDVPRSEARLTRRKNGDAGSWLRVLTSSAGTLRATRSRGRTKVAVSGNNSLIKRVGRGLALFTKMNCSRCTESRSDTKPITGTAKSLCCAWDSAIDRC